MANPTVKAGALVFAAGAVFGAAGLHSCEGGGNNNFGQTLESRIRTAAATGKIMVKDGFRLETQEKPTDSSLLAAEGHAYDSLGIQADGKPSDRQRAIVVCGFSALNFALNQEAATDLNSAFGVEGDQANNKQRDQAFSDAADACKQQIYDHMADTLTFPVNQQ